MVLRELIKTGDITGGTLNTGMLARASVANQFYFANVTLNGTNTITSESCTVTTNPVNVSLDSHDKDEFSGVGTTTTRKTFDIGLNCNKGARINVRIDPAAGAVDNMTDVMKLDDAGSGTTASGVGVQLWFRPNGGSAVKFGGRHFTGPQAVADRKPSSFRRAITRRRSRSRRESPMRRPRLR